MDDLAITRAKLARCRAELFKEEAHGNVQIQPLPLERLEEEKTLRPTSYTQMKIGIHQHLQDEGMNIQELVAKHMNEEKNMAKISFEEYVPKILLEHNYPFFEMDG